MSALDLALAATALVAISGVPGLALARGARAGERSAAALLGSGAILGIAAASLCVARGAEERVLGAPIPLGSLAVGIDGLSALFLFPIFAVAALGALYALGYFGAAEHAEGGRRLRLAYGLLTAGMALVALARDGVLFLVGWEITALAAFFAVTTEDRDPAVREAGFLYLACTRASALALLGVFALLAQTGGSFAFAAYRGEALSGAAASGAFALALVGFGLKAGIFPLHVWLPSAHAAAPSHVSALLSGVVIKLGIYGLLRFATFFPEAPAGWGLAVLALGAISAVLGVAAALGQHDLKRLLAYHSIENIGIIAIGLGLALVGRSLGRPEWVALGLAGALLHVWNHGLFKALLFLAAGSVIRASGTREIDALGGIARRMPRTALAFLVGAVAISGLPPLNGFASEFLVYSGLLGAVAAEPGRTWLVAALAVPTLALVGALALACFVKVVGAVFLGEPRTPAAERVTECGAWMQAPMAALAAACAALGLWPLLAAPALDAAIATFASAPGVASVAPLARIGAAAVLLVALIALVGAALRLRLRAGGVALDATWDCGYAAPSPRMQYTGSSFAQMLVGLFAWALRPRVREPRIEGLFPRAASFHSEVPDAVLERALLPAVEAVARACLRLRWLQAGHTHVYVLYILLALLVLLAAPLGAAP
jgi:formate hydrogenlyase subunit 3/multisubunit Na+/H+ antiporter MnhD subunit